MNQRNFLVARLQPVYPVVLVVALAIFLAGAFTIVGNVAYAEDGEVLVTEEVTTVSEPTETTEPVEVETVDGDDESSDETEESNLNEEDPIVDTTDETVDENIATDSSEDLTQNFSASALSLESESTEEKINICHKTSSDGNPWNAIEINESAKDSHFEHNDFIYSGPLKDNGHPDNKDGQADEWCADNAPSGDDDENDDGDDNNSNGAITICKIIVDKDNNIANDSNNLPNGSFSVTISEGDAPSTSVVIETATFNASAFTPNQKVLDGDHNNDADCVTYSGLSIGDYFYSEEIVSGDEWGIVGYNDQYNMSANDITDFLAYDAELYDGDPANDGERNINADGHIVLTADRPERTLLLLNRYTAEEPSEPTLKIIAYKLVCENESDLPNWGEGGPDITATTATDYVNSHPTCHLTSGWDFQWGYGPKDGEAGVIDPGSDFVGEAGDTGSGYNEWKTFGPTDSTGKASVEISDLAGASLIWVREVLKTNYIPFTEPPVVEEKDDVSAEMYCDTDVENYDNYDNISSPALNNTYYCVGFNVASSTDDGGNPPPVVDTGSIKICKVISDEKNNISTSSSGIPANTFSISLFASTNTSPALKLYTAIFGSAAFSPNTSVFSAFDDAECITFGNLPLTHYYYDTETFAATGSPWHAALYNDQFETSVTSLSDFFSYNSELFDGDPSNDGLRNQNADGDISLTADRPNRTLVLLNTFTASIPTSTPTNTPPTITLQGDNPMTITVNTDFIDPGATAFDNEDGNITPNIVKTGSVSTTTIGEYTLTYNVSDSKGLAATPVTRLVKVVEEGGDDDGDDDGGGGGGIGGRRHSIAGSSYPSCDYLRDFLRIDLPNNPDEVIKLQAFLKIFEGESNLAVTGTFDQTTLEAVNRFQNKYFGDILSPWGHDAPTGYVYILTKKKINEIYCQKAYPVTAAEQLEIDEFRAFLESLRSRGGSVDGATLPSGEPIDFGTQVGSADEGATTTGGVLAEGEEGTATSTGIAVGENLRNLAAAVLAVPEGLSGILSCLWKLLVALIIIYLIASIVGGVNNEGKKMEEIRSRKLVTSVVGLVVAVILGFVFKIFCIIVPLLVILILTSAYFLWHLNKKPQ